MGLANYLEGTPKDEVLDVLGFLACEMVRSLCERGLAVKHGYEAAKAAQDDLGPTDSKRSNADADSPERGGGLGGGQMKKRKRTTEEESDDEDDGSAAFRRTAPTGLFTAPARMNATAISSSSSTCNTPGGSTRPTAEGEGATEKEKEKTTPVPERTPLSVVDVEDAYSAMQTGRAKMRMSGMRNFSGGLVRPKVNVI